MNTNNLVRHYDKLTPVERLPLIMAATARGDQIERDQLIHSAPQVTYRLPDHWGAASAFQFLAHVHFMKMLDITARYFQAFATVPDRKMEVGADRSTGWDYLLAIGYEFNTYLSGWRKFCAELNIDAEIMWKHLPGYKTVKNAEELSAGRPDEGVAGAAFVAEGVARYRARIVSSARAAELDEEMMKRCWPESADDIATSLRVAWEARLKEWK